MEGVDGNENMGLIVSNYYDDLVAALVNAWCGE